MKAQVGVLHGLARADGLRWGEGQSSALQVGWAVNQGREQGQKAGATGRSTGQRAGNAMSNGERGRRTWTASGAGRNQGLQARLELLVVCSRWHCRGFSEGQ